MSVSGDSGCKRRSGLFSQAQVCAVLAAREHNKAGQRQNCEGSLKYMFIVFFHRNEF
jgi:hypothetical protein